MSRPIVEKKTIARITVNGNLEKRAQAKSMNGTWGIKVRTNEGLDSYKNYKLVKKYFQNQYPGKKVKVKFL